MYSQHGLINETQKHSNLVQYEFNKLGLDVELFYCTLTYMQIIDRLIHSGLDN